jgi:hypothetical protein
MIRQYFRGLENNPRLEDLQSDERVAGVLREGNEPRGNGDGDEK